MIKKQGCSTGKRRNESQTTPCKHRDPNSGQKSKQQHHPKNMHGKSQHGQTNAKVHRAPHTTSRCDNVRVEVGPRLHLENSKVGNQLMQAITANTMAAPQCQWLGPQKQIDSWIRLGADKVLQQAIKNGIQAPLHQIPDPSNLSISTTAGNTWTQ